MSQTTIIRGLAIALVAVALVAAYSLGASTHKPATQFDPCNVSQIAQLNCDMVGTPSGR